MVTYQGFKPCANLSDLKLYDKTMPNYFACKGRENEF